MKHKGVARIWIIAIAVIVIIVLAVGIYFLTARPAAPPAAKPRPAVKGPVLIYGAIHEFELERLCKAFEEDTGIKAEFVRMSAGEIAARIVAEAKAGRVVCDVFLGGPMIFHEYLKEKGLLYKWTEPPPNAKDIPAKFHDPDGYWFGFYVGGIAICYNTKRIKELGLPVPTSWEDLTKPIYKGHIVIADPRTSGTAFTILETLISIFGYEKGFEMAKKIWGNAGLITKSGAAPGRLVGAGEYAIGVLFAHDIAKVIKAGYPVKMVFPKEGTGWEIGAVSVVKGAPHLEAAKIFVNWILGRRAGQLHTDISLRISTRPDVIPPPGAVPLEKMPLLPPEKFKWKEYAAKKDELLKKWEEVVLGAAYAFATAQIPTIPSVPNNLPSTSTLYFTHLDTTEIGVLSLSSVDLRREVITF